MSQQYTSPEPQRHTSSTNPQQYTPTTPPHYSVPTHGMYTPTTPKPYISPTPHQHASTSQQCQPEHHQYPLEPQSSLSQSTKALTPESETHQDGVKSSTFDRQEQALQRRRLGLHRSPRTVLLKDQIALMKAVYDVNQNPSREVKDRLASATGLPMKVIKIWFQNRRQKSKREKQEAEAVMNFC